MTFSEQQRASYESFLNGEAIYRDPDSTAIEITGKDRAKFLHNFCTADINRLQNGESAEAFVLNAKGKTIAFLLVLCFEDRLVLVVQKSQASELLEHLNKYAFLEDATLNPLEDTQVGWGIGERQAGFTTTLTDSLWVELLDAENKESTIEKNLFNSYRIENKIPVGGVDVLENLAQEFERDATAISFNKGCYLGQETVARLDALGHTNKTLCLIQIDSDDVPDFDAPLTKEEKECGKVTSAGWSPKFGSSIALAMIKKPNHKAGTELIWGDAKVKVVG